MTSHSPQFGRSDLETAKRFSLQHETVVNNYGTLSAKIVPERQMDSEFVVSFITGKPADDRSFWLKVENQYGALETEYDAKLHTLAELAAKNILRRTKDKFSRGMNPPVILVQDLYLGMQEGSEKFVLLPGGAVIPFDA